MMILVIKLYEPSGSNLERSKRQTVLTSLFRAEKRSDAQKAEWAGSLCDSITAEGGMRRV